MSGEPRSILVVELLGGIGDLLLLLPAIHALARTYPRAAVTVLTFAPGDSLLATDPHVAEVVRAEPGPPPQQRRAVQRLLKRDFDLVVSDTRYGDIPAVIEATAAHAVTDLWRQPPADERIDRRFLALLAADGIIDPKFVDLPPKVFLTEDELHAGAALAGSSRPAVLLLPEAGMRIKEWAPLHFRALAQRLVCEHDANVLVASGARSDLARSVADGIARARALAPLSLRELAAVAAGCACCVGGDTGPSRLAASVGTPTVALFGPTWSRRFGLRERHVNLQSPLPCDVRNPGDQTLQSCWYSGRCVFDDRRTCVDDVTVDEVLAAVEPSLILRRMVAFEAV